MNTLPALATLMASQNLTRYPRDLQPWGAHASGITALADGTVLVNWYGGTCRGIDEYDAYIGDPFGASRVYLARLEPGATAFSEPEVIAGDGRIRYMDANLFLDGKRLWAFYVREGSVRDTVVCRLAEEPQGRLWGPEQVVCPISLARIMNPPVRHGKDILAPLSAFDKDKQHSPWRDVIISQSTDDGASWNYLARIEARDRLVCLREPCLVSLADELQMYARVVVYSSTWTKAEPDDPRWRVHRSISRDGGATWSQPEPVDIPNFDSKISVVALDDGALAMAHNSTPGRFPLSMSVSRDRGATWSPAGVIDAGPGEMSYPTLHRTLDGLLHLSYTWKRREIYYKCMDPKAFLA